MKEFMEEYGGVIVTCMLGIMLLGLLYSLLASIWKNRSNGNYPGRIICICLESY